MCSTPSSLLGRLRQPISARGWTEDWVRLVDLYSPLLYHWARRLGLGEGDTADLVQDVFLSLVRKLPRFEYDGQRSFRGWLHTVLINCWRDRLRQPAPPIPAGAEILAGAAVPDPVLELEEAEYRRHLMHLALQLMQRDFQPRTWQACWATVVEGRPAADVAAELGLTVAAVYAATARVLRRLRQELEGFLD